MSFIPIPFRLIDRIYGRDESDEIASDEIVYALQQVSEWPGQYKYRFRFDTLHPNPWYHTLVFEVDDMPQPVVANLLMLLAELGLMGDGVTKS